MERIADDAFMGHFPLRAYRMENGLEVYLIHNPVAPVAAYLTYYRVGSALEDDSQRGLAHFFEHMMFRETVTLRDGEFDRKISEMGGVGLNAYTSFDATVYHVSVPTENLPQLIALEADRMGGLRLLPDQIEAERGAVLGEMHMYQDMPSEAARDTLMAAAFARHPYRHPIIGYVPQVEGFADADFRRFYEENYAPNRACIVIAGGFEEAPLLESLRAAYGHLPPGKETPAPHPADGPWSDHRWLELRHEKISTENLSLAWQSPGASHADFPALYLLSGLLSAGQSAPIHQRLVHAGLASTAYAYVLEAEMAAVSPGLFMVEMVMQHGQQAEAGAEAVQALLEELGNGGIPQVEWTRALSQVRLGSYSAMRTNMSMGREVGDHLIAHGDPLYFQSFLRQVEAVTPEDLQRVLRRYLLETPRLAVAQRPGPDTPAAGSGSAA